jgi:NTP pyrophosphatase (non-canonical NTP hydrolase)
MKKPEINSPQKRFEEQNKKTRADWETDDFIYGISVLLATKPLDKTLCKALEELNELSVKLLQYINKPESIANGDIEEEIADVEMHLKLLKNYFPVSSSIRKRKIKKFLQSKDYKNYLKKL